MVAASRVRSYGLAPVFEQLVAQHCAASGGFWARIGKFVDPEALGDESSTLIVRACFSVAEEHGQPPRSAALVAQRLHRWREQGKSTADEVQRAGIILAAAEDNVGGDVDENALVTELAPVLRRRLQKVALEQAVIDYGKQGDMTRFSDMISKAGRIGEQSAITGGHRLGSQILQTFAAEDTSKRRLKTGVPELDAMLGDGVQDSVFSVVMGSTSAGKSMFLGHIAAEAVSARFNVAYATLELPLKKLFARITGNLTDLPTEDILRYPDVMSTAVDRMRVLEEEGLIGLFTAEHFTSGLTTLDDILEWKRAEEQATGVKIHAVMIDSGNDLVEAGSKAPKFEQQELIAKRIRSRANKEGEWWWSSAQANAEGMDSKKTKRVESHHAAYSKGISRAAELIISLNPRDDGTLYHIAKNTNGEAGSDVGPLARDCAFGRISPIARLGWPW